MKTVLAYSGGLDTSIIIPWLKEHYHTEVIAVCVNLGSVEDPQLMQTRARASGASKLYIVDARQEFTQHYLLPLLRTGALYEGTYYLGTAIARPLQAAHQVRIATAEQAHALCHGCTGKGNDQIRFEMAYRVLAPHLQVIAPWREWDITSRSQAIDYATARNIPLDGISKKQIYSRDANIWHTSHEGGEIEDLDARPPQSIYLRTRALDATPTQEEEIAIDWQRGTPTALNGTPMDPLKILLALNRVGAAHGIGRADIVESRITGMKSRGLYETPGGTILYRALQELESITLSRELRTTKHILAHTYANLVYSGKWFTHLRQSIDAFAHNVSRVLTGTIKLVLYKGNIGIAGRASEHSLYNQDLSSFDTQYNHQDANGFIKLYGLQFTHQPTAYQDNTLYTQKEYPL